MKKLSVLVLALVLVVSFASVSFAASTTYGGEVGVQLSQGAFSTASQSANFVIDYTKNYNDNLSAGLTVKYDSGNTVGLDLTTDPTNPVTKAPLLPFDTTGWIKFNYSPLVVTAKTSADGGVTKDILTNAMPAGAGVQVDYTVMEGLTATIIGNTNNDGFNYLAKAAYSGDALTLGGGYQADAAENGTDAIGAYGSFTVAGITAAVEYNNRLGAKASAILAKVGGTFGPATVNAAFINQGAIVTLDDDNADQDWAAYEWMRFNGNSGNAVKADVTVKLTEALSLNGNVQMILNGQKWVVDDKGTTDTADDVNVLADYADTDKLSYKAGASYALTESLIAEASYKSAFDKNAVNVTITDTFAAGLVGTLSLDMNLGTATTTSYTAKVVATL